MVWVCRILTLLPLTWILKKKKKSYKVDEWKDIQFEHLINKIISIVIFKSHSFNNITCSHIYREHNKGADKLSKEAALMDKGIWEITEIQGQQEHKYYHRPYIDPGYQTTPGHQTIWSFLHVYDRWNFDKLNIFLLNSKMCCRKGIL